MWFGGLLLVLSGDWVADVLLFDKFNVFGGVCFLTTRKHQIYSALAHERLSRCLRRDCDDVLPRDETADSLQHLL